MAAAAQLTLPPDVLAGFKEAIGCLVIGTALSAWCVPIDLHASQGDCAETARLMFAMQYIRRVHFASIPVLPEKRTRLCRHEIIRECRIPNPYEQELTSVNATSRSYRCCTWPWRRKANICLTHSLLSTFDTVSMCLTVVTLYDFVVTDFGNPALLFSVPP